jgi:hypothetical protein
MCSFFMEVTDMTNLTGTSVRFGLIALAAAVLSAGLCGDASAGAHKQRVHARSAFYESHAQLVSQAPTHLGPMRYYGGPKSPMWRGPAE